MNKSIEKRNKNTNKNEEKEDEKVYRFKLFSVSKAIDFGMYSSIIVFILSVILWL